VYEGARTAQWRIEMLSHADCQIQEANPAKFASKMKEWCQKHETECKLLGVAYHHHGDESPQTAGGGVLMPTS